VAEVREGVVGAVGVCAGDVEQGEDAFRGGATTGLVSRSRSSFHNRLSSVPHLAIGVALEGRNSTQLEMNVALHYISQNGSTRVSGLVILAATFIYSLLE